MLHCEHEVRKTCSNARHVCIKNSFWDSYSHNEMGISRTHLINSRSWSTRSTPEVVSDPLTVTVTTRIITFSIGDPYKPSFATGILGGGHPQSIREWVGDYSELQVCSKTHQVTSFVTPKWGPYDKQPSLVLIFWRFGEILLWHDHP